MGYLQIDSCLMSERRSALLDFSYLNYNLFIPNLERNVIFVLVGDNRIHYR